MNIFQGRIPASLLIGLLAVLAGCGGSGLDPAENAGRISLGISDGPIHDATKVCITFDAIEFKGEGSSTTVSLEPPEKVNLLDFQGQNAAPILVNHQLPAGQYQWLRLYVDAELGSNGGMGDTGGVECDGEGSYIAMSGGGVYNLYVPSSANSGLKLVGGFTVPANAGVNFTAEVDLMKSFTAPPGLSPDVIMKPAIRLVNNVDAGTLVGQVDNNLAAAEGCAPSVFVFNDGVTPNPIEDEVDDPNDPVATAMVNAEINNEEQTEYRYTVGFLLAGNYEVAFSCDGMQFEPVEGKSASITANEVTTVNFLPE